MRMDFNRIGGPGRALSRDDMRVVPLEVKKTIPSGIMPLPGKKDDEKNIAKKKGSNVARVSHPKSVSGGKGKQDVGNGPNLQINPAIAEVYAATGGNIGDVSRFDEFAERLGLGPLTVANPLFPNNDDTSFPFPWPKTDQESSDRNFIYGWSGYGGAPGGPDTSKTGQAEGGGWTEVTGLGSQSTSQRNGEVYHHAHRVYVFQDNEGNSTRSSAGDTRMVIDTTVGSDGSSKSTTTFYGRDGVTVISTNSEAGVADLPVPEDRRGNKESGEDPKKEAKKKDSQPVEEGYGRPSNGGGGWCSPTGGCLRPARNNGSPRIIPSETDGGGMVSAHRQSPSWATDPNPDGLGGTGGGSGYSGYTPEDEEDGDNGGPGNPALEALDAAL
jgi:hypothetical protein